MVGFGGREEVVIDAAPGVQGPRSVIVINNGVLAIWPQTGHFVCPQSSLDKWREGEVGGGCRFCVSNGTDVVARSRRGGRPPREICFFLFLPSCLQAGGRRLPGNLRGVAVHFFC